jgi:hypothetical protein
VASKARIGGSMRLVFLIPRRHVVVFAVLLLTSVLLSACAYIEIRPLTSKEKQNEAANNEDAADLNGVRFYRAVPHVLISQTTDGLCTLTVVQLPNYDKEYIIIPHRGIGIVTFNPTLADGWNLTAFSATVDSKVPETLTAIASLMTSAISAAKPGAKEIPPNYHIATAKTSGVAIEASQGLSPGLYRVNIGSSGIQFYPVFTLVNGKGEGVNCLGFGPTTAASPPKTP